MCIRDSTNRGQSSCYLYDQHFYTDTNNSYDIGNNSTRWRNGYFGNKLFDGKGELRNIPQNSQTSSYSLQASDAGKHIKTTAQVTIASGVFNIGDAVTIINSTGSDITIAQGTNTTVYSSADGSTGNRTLAGRGMATCICTDSNYFYISGAGLS